MIIKIEQENGQNVNFYEGKHISFHPSPKNINEYFVVVIEDLLNPVTFNLEYDGKTRIFLMNSCGKTIESVSI